MGGGSKDLPDVNVKRVRRGGSKDLPDMNVKRVRKCALLVGLMQKGR